MTLLPSADEKLFIAAVRAIYLLVPFSFLPLIFTTAPYGRHTRSGWGPSLQPPIAWFLMESPALWLSLYLLPFGRHRSEPIALFIISLFFLHYIHRTLIYPLRLRRVRTLTAAGANVPISVIAMGFGFNLLNAYIQTRSVTHYADYGGKPWTSGVLTAARVMTGLGIFVWGMAVNVRSDLALFKLKAEGGGYKVPHGGWFEQVSCPNYMGELAEWLGWAVISWSPAAFGFVVFTAANLVPRARSHHKWYLQKFGADYPRSRKAVVPYVF